MYCIVNILVRELSKITFKSLIKVRKILFPYVSNCPMAYACCFGYFVMWVASLQKRDDILYFMREERLYGVDSKEEADVLVYLHLGSSLL
jgi:hypothetical protein